MARRLNVAVCQTGPIARAESRADVVARLIALLETAAAGGAELAVFPEMALTTFFPRWDLTDPDEIRAFYEREMPGPDTAPLFAAARRLKVGFALGYCESVVEDGRERRFNTMVLAGRDGAVIGRYRKMHVPGSEAPEEGVTVHLERRYFEPGNLGFPVFSFEGVRIGMAICNDRRWPETYRMLCLNGAEMVLIGYNTPLLLTETPRLAHLRMFHNHLPMQAGAYQNTVWIAAAAKAGVEEGQALIGGSCIIAPSGEIVALANSLGDEVIVHRADLAMNEDCAKAGFDFARYRRPDEYALIAQAAGPRRPATAG
ncbi:putative amidohydrolase [Angulomicrobium tetraedrale]|uniref:Putative amidohydrolase n=1 Tax=Ancylobacter tetraedralis TaxID=217068 RepID=A0A839Z7D2_9HYPH|nr:nitrilase-related carbon-nitrogen hydrolase [Ancylobacter tetraedralis]MBB3770356.1 putative amidohydrolase [Ancylobacter tetraedralis]